MIDYFAHVAVFESVRTALVGVTDAGLASARDKLLADAAAYPEAALLGTLVDHLLMHTTSTGAEIEILGRAADLWKSGRAVYDTAGCVRTDVESVMKNPTAPGAEESFNVAMATFIGLRPKLAAIQADMDALGSDVTQWQHLPNPHPRQRDETISGWDWGDRFLARRTEAFVRAAFKDAQGPRTSAFALGALASYAGNVAGSAYLGHVVGGPRRTHPRRDRIARNAVGAWIRANRTLPDLQRLSAEIHRNGSAGQSSFLRSDLEGVLQKCLTEAFPGTPPANLSLGLARLETHLALLAVFVRPPLPVPPSPTLMATMAPLDADGSVDFDSQPDPNDPPYGPPPPMGPDLTPTKPSRTNDAALWVVCAAIVVTALYLLIDGIVALAKGRKYDPWGDLHGGNIGDAPDENVNFSAQQLKALSSSSGGTLMIEELFSFQMKVWQAMEDALTFLVKKGLVYPDELTIGGITFSQFTALGPLSPWPLRTEVAIDEGYLDFPSGTVEHPPATASPFPVGATPFTFVDVPSVPVSFQAAPTEAVRLWLQIARAEHDSVNLDLDADRGHHAPCWQVADKTSIDDDPVIVDVLPYTGL
jgi:hypothetical protein